MGELKNVEVDNSVIDPRAEVEEQLADNGGPSDGEAKLNTDDDESSTDDGEPISELEMSPERKVARERASVALT